MKRVFPEIEAFFCVQKERFCWII